MALCPWCLERAQGSFSWQLVTPCVGIALVDLAECVVGVSNLAVVCSYEALGVGPQETSKRPQNQPIAPGADLRPKCHFSIGNILWMKKVISHLLPASSLSQSANAKVMSGGTPPLVRPGSFGTKVLNQNRNGGTSPFSRECNSSIEALILVRRGRQGLSINYYVSFVFAGLYGVEH